MWICLEKAFYCIIQNCPIGLVFMIIAYEYVTFLILCLIPWFSSNPISTSFVAIEFHFFVILLIISYWKSCFNSPGTIPENINDYFPQVQEIREKCIQIKKNNEFQRRKAHPKYKDNENTLINEEKPETYQAINMDICKTKEMPIISEIHLEINDISYCFKCDKIKMPRAHHCRICNKCILRMDHHCPWTGNCVGLKNHKYFVLFLSYACISLLNIFLCMANTSYTTLFGHMRDEEFSKIINTLLCFVIAFTFFIAIFGLLCYNIYSLSRNITTIELNIPDIEKRNPFKKESALENIQEVLGEDMWFWWLPTIPKFKEEYHQLDISFAQSHKL